MHIKKILLFSISLLVIYTITKFFLPVYLGDNRVCLSKTEFYILPAGNHDPNSKYDLDFSDRAIQIIYNQDNSAYNELLDVYGMRGLQGQISISLQHYPFEIASADSHDRHNQELLDVITGKESFKYYSRTPENSKTVFRGPKGSSVTYIFDTTEELIKTPFRFWEGTCSINENYKECSIFSNFDKNTTIDVDYPGELYLHGKSLLSDIIEHLKRDVIRAECKK